jgi:hypothetical protein
VLIILSIRYDLDNDILLLWYDLDRDTVIPIPAGSIIPKKLLFRKHDFSKETVSAT